VSTSQRHRARAGITLIETTVSMLIVSLLIVSAVGVLGQVSLGRSLAGDRARGQWLAHDLLAEIRSMRYESTDFGPGSFGRAADEPEAGPRSLYNDVDDFHGWRASPPQTPEGDPIPGYEGWTRSVAVQWVDADANPSGSDTRIKRITVTIQRDERVVVSAVAFRAAAWDEIGPERGTEPADGTPPATDPLNLGPITLGGGESD